MNRDRTNKNVTRMQKQTRTWIKEALMQLLKDYSFEDITIKQIVLTADISRPTFYRNYDSKKTVLDDALNDLMDEYYSKFKASNITNLRDLLMFCFDYFENDHEYLSTMIAAHLTSYITDNFTSKFAEKLNDTQTWREWKTPLQKQIGIRFAFYGFFNIIIFWIATGCKESPETMTEQTIEVLENLT